MGRPGVVQEGGVHRYNFPRSDLHVTVDGVDIRPTLALGGWVAMQAVPDGVVAMGDLVLTDTELALVVSRLQEGGVEQTAIHHHLVRESPRVLYVHVHARGAGVKIAQAIRAAMSLTQAPPLAASAGPAVPLALDSAGVLQALGRAGRVNGGVLQFSVPRSETIRDGGFVIPAAMGLGSVVNFQPTGQGKAAITGDFVLRADQVNPVIALLGRNGVEVTALHSHMLNEEPRLFFMHFWANADAVSLARTMRAALDVRSAKPAH